MPETPAPGRPGSWLQDDPSSWVERALAGLDGLADRPVAEHVEVFDGVHRALQDALATLDSA